MTLPSLSDLLTIPTQDEVIDGEVLPELRSRGARVTDWLTGGVYRAMAYVVSRLRVLARTETADLAAAGFEDWAFGFSSPPGGLDVTSWAPIIAKQRYGVERIEATTTKRTIRLTNASATVYGPIAEGGIIVLFPATGNRYILDEETTIPAAGYVDARFRSEYATNSAAGITYIGDAAGATIRFVTASYPGVTATNPAPTYADVVQVGSGLGLVTPSGSPTAHTLALRIDTSGQVAAGTWSTSLDGGSWASQGAIGTLTNFSGTGITVTPTNNGGNPAFVAGTIYFVTAPGSDVTQVGRDVETPQELGARCRGLWPMLAFLRDADGNALPLSPTMGAYEALVRSASTQVKNVYIKTGSVNNELLIYVAGQGAPLSLATRTAIQAFLDSLAMLTDLPVVASPASRTITLAGATVTVKRGQSAAAKVEAQRRLALYFAGTDPAALLPPNGRVDHAYLASLLRTTPGVTKLTDSALTINGAASDLQLPVSGGAIELAVWSQAIASALTWTDV